MLRPLLSIALLVAAVHSYSPAPRWGQATSIIYSALYIQGGKQNPDGSQTYTSAPAEADLLLLPLNAQFDVSSPPWQLISDPANATNSHGPTVAWHTLSAYTSTSLLLFGGFPSPSVPLATQNDSAWLLDVYNRGIPAFTDEPPGWDGEPMRRYLHAAVTAPTGEVYIFGGEKADLSQEMFADNYVFNPATGQFILLPTEGAPPALSGHAAVILSNGQILIFGGLSSSGLLSFEQIYVFDTSTNTWSLTTASSTSLPTGRRQFACTLFDDNTIYIHGGCDDVCQNNFNDGWTYNIASSTWSSVQALGDIGGRRDHFAVSYADQIIFGFGYEQNNPANASIIVYDPALQSYPPSYTPPAPSSTPTLTVPVSSASSTSTPSLTGSASSVQPSSTDGAGGSGSGSGGGGNGGGNGGGSGTDGKSPQSSTNKTTTIAVASVLGALALVMLGLGAVWYMRKQHQRRWAEGGVGGVFSPLNDDDEDGHGAPTAAHMFDSSSSHQGLLGGTVETVGSAIHSWGTWAAGLVGLGAAGGVAATARDRKHRRDMLADEDNREFGWYPEDGNSTRMGRLRDGSGDSTWSLMNVFRPRPRREGSGASAFSFSSRLERGPSLRGHGDGPSEKDPLRDEFPGAAGVMAAASTRPRVNSRQQSFSSAHSATGNYVDPFADPIAEQDIVGPGSILAHHYPRTGPLGPLSPVTEVSRISSSQSEFSSNDHQPLSPFDSVRSRSSFGFSSNSHQASPGLPPGASPAATPGSGSSSAPQTRPRLTSILDMQPTRPSQPIQRSDTWWKRFAGKSLLDRRGSGRAGESVAVPEFRDPNPLPQRLGFVAEETASVLRERSDGSDTSRGPVYGRTAGHGKSMSSLQTQRTADSGAIERMGNVDVMVRGNRQSGSTSTRESIITGGGGSVDEGNGRHSWQPVGEEEEAIYTSPVEMVPASAFGLTGSPSPPRAASPPPPSIRPPLSTASSSSKSSGSAGSGAVAERVRAYERRMSQDVNPKQPHEDRPRTKKPHGVNYGLVARQSLFVANPDHQGSGSGDS